MATVTTPWGKATSVEEARVAQRSGERRFTTRVELLESAEGEQLIRFSYATGGSVRRGPVTLRARDVAKLGAALERVPELRRLVRRLGTRDDEP